MANDQLLDLGALVERPQIRIDGKLYDILSPDELSLVDHHRYGKLGVRLQALTRKADVTDDEADELSAIVRDLSDRIMVGVPDDLRARLGERHRLQVIEVFTKLLPQAPRSGRRAAVATRPRRTPSRSGRASNGSTAARRAGG